MVTTRNHIIWLIDYIDRRGAVQSNSLAVQELMRSSEFNNHLQGSNAVLFGYSMGGLIARHALLSVEDEGFQHNIGAYVSLDAPHRGAFIPPALEVISRTMLNLTYGGLAQFATKAVLREELGKAVDAYNSPAARQLLGIYIGKGVPKYRKYGKVSDDTTGRWDDYNRFYMDMIADNDLARHKSFYELREEIVDLGAYPTRSLNIGVSFGRADGARLMDPEDRSPEPAGFKMYAGGLQLAEVDIKSTRGWKLCKVELISRSSRSCPNFGLFGQHLQSVFVSPGSTINTIGKTISTIQEKEVQGLTGGELVAAAYVDFSFGTKGLATYFAASGVDVSAFSTEDELTFIPMVSAYDDKGWARDYPNGTPIGALQSPFDVLIADSSSNAVRSHKTITNNLVTQIVVRLASAQVYTRQKNRIGGDGHLAHSPNSSYFDSNSGVFDFARYILPTSVRELPVVSDANAEAYLTKRTSDDAIVAAAIASL